MHERARTPITAVIGETPDHLDMVIATVGYDETVTLQMDPADGALVINVGVKEVPVRVALRGDTVLEVGTP